MSIESQQDLMVAEAKKFLQTLEGPLTTMAVLELMVIGFKHGAIWKADQVQLIISRLEGIEINGQS